MTVQWVRRLVLATVGCVLAASAAGAALALAQPRASLRTGITLWIALAALVVSVGKVILDLFVSPEDQAVRQRMARHEERVEVVAGRVRQLLGLTGALLSSRVTEAWNQRDAEQLRESAQVLGDLAERAYHELETTSDALEISIGVLMVEAWELADAAPALATLPPEEWTGHASERHLSTVEQYVEQIQTRLHEIQDRGRRA